MDLSIENIAQLVVNKPVLVVIIGLILWLMYSNGASDAPNTVTTAVSTKSISPNNFFILLHPLSKY